MKTQRTASRSAKMIQAMHRYRLVDNVIIVWFPTPQTCVWLSAQSPLVPNGEEHRGVMKIHFNFMHAQLQFPASLSLFTSANWVYPIAERHTFTFGLSPCCCLFEYNSLSAFSSLMLPSSNKPSPPVTGLYSPCGVWATKPFWQLSHYQLP